MKANFYGRLFRFIRGIVRIVYPKYSVQIPKINGPVVYISHHQNLFGPFVILLWFTNVCIAGCFMFFLIKKLVLNSMLTILLQKDLDGTNGWQSCVLFQFPILFQLF